jgi:hypothetical protein
MVVPRMQKKKQVLYACMYCMYLCAVCTECMYISIVCISVQYVHNNCTTHAKNKNSHAMNIAQACG